MFYGDPWLPKKIMRIMKLTTFFVFLLTLSVSASSYSQNSKLNLKITNGLLVDALKQIEDQSDYYFYYNNADVLNLQAKSIDVENGNIDELMSNLLVGTGLEYKMIDRYIVLKKTGEETSFTSTQQAISVSGKVTDSDGQALPGVTVMIKGTQNGTITDFDGNYTLKGVDGSAVLIFSFVGMKVIEVPIAGKSTISVTLEEETIGLEEVVAVGYGTQKKANLTGAVGNVQMDDLESRPLTNASLALQGTVSGVYALQNSGKPGDDSAVIDIRGVGTWGNNSPLIIIDGFPGSMSDVNPNDIKSISVLKDAASSSIYGNRAANGVILITTKRGDSGKMQVSYTGYYGVQKATRLPHTLNSVEYVTLHREASENAGRVQTYSLDDLAKFEAHNDPMYPDIDYFDVYYGQANTQNHRLSMTGGSENVKYAFMLGQLDQDGIMVATNYKKTDFRSNVDAYFLNNKKLRLSTKLAGNLGVKGEPTSVWNATWYATLAPIYPLQNADGEYMSVNGELNPYAEIKAGSTSKNSGIILMVS